jgi:sporulation protein YlmC with PRC-barrel domain
MMSPPYASRLLAVAALVALSACSSMRHTRPPPAPESSPPPETVAAPPTLPEADSAANDSSNDSRPPDMSSATPACTCVETKPKPKPKPKPRPVRKEAPPQLPTAPVVVEAPKGAIVDAEVKPMSVSVMSILGKKVQGPKGEDLGRVVDVLADDTGRVRIAIIDFGGFLGVGDRRIAVDWPLLRFNPDNKDPSLLLSITREKLQGAPEYKANPRPQTLMEMPATPPPATPPPATTALPATTAPPATAPPATTPSPATTAPAQAPAPPESKK